jgi:uncharacterized protein YceH (UPF0502 family)
MGGENGTSTTTADDFVLVPANEQTSPAVHLTAMQTAAAADSNCKSDVDSAVDSAATDSKSFKPNAETPAPSGQPPIVLSGSTIDLNFFIELKCTNCGRTWHSERPARPRSPLSGPTCCHLCGSREFKPTGECKFDSRPGSPAPSPLPAPNAAESIVLAETVNELPVASPVIATATATGVDSAATDSKSSKPNAVAPPLRVCANCGFVWPPSATCCHSCGCVSVVALFASGAESPTVKKPPVDATATPTVVAVESALPTECSAVSSAESPVIPSGAVVVISESPVLHAELPVASPSTSTESVVLVATALKADGMTEPTTAAAGSTTAALSAMSWPCAGTDPAEVAINSATGSAAETKCPTRTDAQPTSRSERMHLVLKLLSSFYWRGHSTCKFADEQTVWQMVRIHFTADSPKDSGAAEDLKGSVAGDGSSLWSGHVIPFTLRGTFHLRWSPPSIVMQIVKQHTDAKFANEIQYEVTLRPVTPGTICIDGTTLSPGNDWSGVGSNVVDLSESTITSIEPVLMLRVADTTSVIPTKSDNDTADTNSTGHTLVSQSGGSSGAKVSGITIMAGPVVTESSASAADLSLPLKEIKLKAVKSYLADLHVESKALEAEIAELEERVLKSKTEFEARLLKSKSAISALSIGQPSATSGGAEAERTPSSSQSRPGLKTWVVVLPIILCLLLSGVVSHLLISRIQVLEQHEHVNSQDQLKIQVRVDRLERERGAFSDNLLEFSRKLLSTVEPSPETIPPWLNAKTGGSPAASVLNPAPNATVLNPSPVRLEACTGVDAWWTNPVGLTDRGDRFLPGPGWRLRSGEFIRTTDCLRYLVMQNDCNLVMYIPGLFPGPAGGKTHQRVWESNTAVAEPHGPCSASFVLGRRFHRVYVCLPGVDCKPTGLHMPVLDGDVPTGLVLSHGLTGPLSLSLAFDEAPLPPLTLNHHSSGGTTAIATSTASNALEPCKGLWAKGLTDRGDRLLPGPWQLSRGEYIRTADCRHYALMQDDCNLVIYRSPEDGYNGMGSAVWASQTHRREVDKPWPKCRAFLRVVHPIATNSVLLICEDARCSDPVVRLENAKVTALLISPKDRAFMGIL